MDYKKAGVDIEAGYKSVELMKEHVKKTMREEVLGGLGGFSGAFSLAKIKNMEEPVLLSGTDGCGTKVKLAIIMDKHDTVHGEAALTHYELLFYQPQTDTSLLKIYLETGRTHQIRVHMKHIGHPLYGDFLYNPDYRFLQRQSLHSWKLSFLHPVSGIPMEFTAPVPADMQQFLPDARTNACPAVTQ